MIEVIHKDLGTEEVFLPLDKNGRLCLGELKEIE